MTKEHPTTPPEELIEKWAKEWSYNREPYPLYKWISMRAAQWGSDQELEACCNIALVDRCCGTKDQRRLLVQHIKERRRPRVTSLKEQALKAMDRMWSGGSICEDWKVLRHVIEQLPDNMT